MKKISSKLTRWCQRSTSLNPQRTLLARASPIANDLVAPIALGTIVALAARVLVILTVENIVFGVEEAGSGRERGMDLLFL